MISLLLEHRENNLLRRTENSDSRYESSTRTRVNNEYDSSDRCQQVSVGKEKEQKVDCLM